MGPLAIPYSDTYKYLGGTSMANPLAAGAAADDYLNVWRYHRDVTGDAVPDLILGNQVADAGGVVHVTPFVGYLFDTTDEELVAAIRARREAAGLPLNYLYPFELYWELHDPDEQQAFLAEAFGMKYTRIVVTAHDDFWLQAAVRESRISDWPSGRTQFRQ